MRPSFLAKYVQQSAPGNAPGVNDGAGAVLVMSREKADALGLKPLARIVAHAEVAEDYPYLATVPALAIAATGQTACAATD